jgi:CRP-like cAMP-binding protein
MNKEQIIEDISRNYSFLTDECRIDLKKSSQILQRNQETKLLVKEGQFADKMYYLIKGSARAFYLKDGKDITDLFAFENEFICSINSFFLNIPSPHYIEILEPSILLEISKDSIIRLSDKHIKFDKLSKAIVTKIMIQLHQRIVSIQFETAQQKYDALLKVRPDITQRAPLTHIASYLGITLETLSRIRNPRNRI